MLQYVQGGYPNPVRAALASPLYTMLLLRSLCLTAQSRLLEYPP